MAAFELGRRKPKSKGKTGKINAFAAATGTAIIERLRQIAGINEKPLCHGESPPRFRRGFIPPNACFSLRDDIQ